MKRSIFTKLILATVTVFAAVGFSLPVCALHEPETNIPPTFDSKISDDGNRIRLNFGDNLLLLGNNLDSTLATPGLFLSFGNDLRLKSSSEYAFIAGNTVSVESVTEKDLFAAGNLVSLNRSAKIGRDVFASAYSLTVDTDLPGDLSVTASQVIFKNAKVSGNVNLNVGTVVFEGETTIDGTLVINEDAVRQGFDNVKFAKLETYQDQDSANATILWMQKFISMFSLALAAVLILLMWPRARACLTSEATVRQFGNDLVIGLATLILVPILAILCLISSFAAPLGLILILLFIIIIYLSQAFAGVWLGHLLVSKLFRSSAPVYVEAIIGILILGCLSMVPGLGVLTGFLGLLIGLGLIIRSCRHDKTDISAQAKSGNDSRTKDGAKVVTNSHSVSKTSGRKTKANSRRSKKSASSLEATGSTKKH